MAEQLEDFGFNLDEVRDELPLLPAGKEGVEKVAVKDFEFVEETKEGKTTRYIQVTYGTEDGRVARVRHQDPTTFKDWATYDADKKKQMARNFGSPLKHIVNSYYDKEQEGLNAPNAQKLFELLKGKLPSNHASIYHPRIKFIYNVNGDKAYVATPSFPPFISSATRPVAEFPYNPKYDIFTRTAPVADGPAGATGGGSTSAGKPKLDI